MPSSPMQVFQLAVLVAILGVLVAQLRATSDLEARLSSLQSSIEIGFSGLPQAPSGYSPGIDGLLGRDLPPPPPRPAEPPAEVPDRSRFDP